MVDIRRKYRGVSESPMARSADEHMLYSMENIIPSKIIRIYERDIPIMPAGVLSALSIGVRKVTLKNMRKTAVALPRIREAATLFLTPFSSFAPKNLAVMTEKPFVSPSKNPIIREFREEVAPTAASAVSPRQLPTIRVSARL